jgi:hypothetical protein
VAEAQRRGYPPDMCVRLLAARRDQATPRQYRPSRAVRPFGSASRQSHNRGIERAFGLPPVAHGPAKLPGLWPADLYRHRRQATSYSSECRAKARLDAVGAKVIPELHCVAFDG